MTTVNKIDCSNVVTRNQDCINAAWYSYKNKNKLTGSEEAYFFDFILPYFKALINFTYPRLSPSDIDSYASMFVTSIASNNSTDNLNDIMNSIYSKFDFVVTSDMKTMYTNFLTWFQSQQKINQAARNNSTQQQKGGRSKRHPKSKWTPTGRRITIPDGSKRALYANPAMPGELRIRKMRQHGRDGRTTATYVKPR